MDLYDQHLHSHHSFDSKTEPVDNVESALAKGLAGLTFTEHFDTHPDDWKECVYDDERYSAEIRRLRERYGSKIAIGKGIEVCYQPDRMDFILDFLDSHEFDLVLLSVHYFAGRPVHKRECWTGVDAAAGTRIYLEGVRDAMRACAKLHERRGKVFHVLSHLDFVKRYTKRFFGTFYVASHGDLFDDILRACLDADIVPEINTSTLRQGLGESMPGPDTVKRYAALGGTCMSLGSDAHRAEDIGADFGTALAMLRDAGINRLAVFENRRRRLISLAHP